MINLPLALKNPKKKHLKNQNQPKTKNTPSSYMFCNEL